MPPLTTRSGSFSYRKLKKLPPSADHEYQLDVDEARQYHHSAAATAAIQDYYRQAAAAIVARRNRTSFIAGGGGWRRQRPRRRRLRISGLARLLRRKAAAVSGKVRSSVAKVVGRLREGGPYVGDLFAGNYLFLQVTPSSAGPAGRRLDKGFLPYYYQVKNKQAAGPVQGLIRA